MREKAKFFLSAPGAKKRKTSSRYFFSLMPNTNSGARSQWKWFFSFCARQSEAGCFFFTACSREKEKKKLMQLVEFFFSPAETELYHGSFVVVVAGRKWGGDTSKKSWVCK